MKKLVMMVLVLVAVGGTTEVNAQGWLKKLGKTVENAAKNAIERNAERKTEDAVDKVFNGDIGKGKKNKNKQNNNDAEEVYDNGDGAAQAQPQKGQSLEMTYAKSDFVPGDEIIFEDLLVGEKLGEFPSMWDLKEGNAEVVSV
ncbi:MAG: OmpA family protein, partial [Bacteroidales bacterium]|nr:OmpA family protein [Bacteroidales bacterium]